MSTVRTISKQGTPLKCHRCNHEWFYTGKNQYIATCPYCRACVTIRKNIVLLIDQISQPKQSVDTITVTSKDGAYNNG